MGKVDEMVDEKIEAPELELWLGALAKAISNASPTSTVEGNNSHYVIPKADFNELGKTHRKIAKILYGNVSTAPNTRQRAERAAARIASEINGSDRDDQSRPPELVALLIDPSIDNEVKLGKWLADIIAAEFER